MKFNFKRNLSYIQTPDARRGDVWRKVYKRHWNYETLTRRILNSVHYKHEKKSTVISKENQDWDQKYKQVIRFTVYLQRITAI